MLNEDRIKIMIDLAIYEERSGKKNSNIGKFFRGDYISFHILKSVIYATIAFSVMLGLYVFYSFEDIMQDIYKMDLLFVGKRIITIYLIFIIAYSFVTYIVYLYRYNRSSGEVGQYKQNLGKLAMIYKEENKNKLKG